MWLAGGGCGWNLLWVWLVGVVVRRYIDFLILLIPTKKMFFFLVPVLYVSNNIFAQYKHTYGRLRVSHGSHYEGCT